MAHPQQHSFCLQVRRSFPSYFSGVWVLDVGSLDINGSNRALFDHCGYIGVDLAMGKNVDFAIAGHQVSLPDGSFDTIVSTECFEHDARYRDTLKNIVRLLKPGGLLFFTCATDGRPEHGTRRTTPDDAPLLVTVPEWMDHYRTLNEADVRDCIDVDEEFSKYEFSTNDESHDLYFWGIKRGKFAPTRTYSFHQDPIHLEVDALRSKVAEFEGTIREGMPGFFSLAAKHQRAETRLAELAILAQETTSDRRAWQLKAEELERQVEGLRGQIAWFENTRSWKVTKGLRFLSRMQREGVLPPLRSFVVNRLRLFGLVREAPPPPTAADTGTTPAPEPTPAPTAGPPRKLVFDHRHIRVLTTKHSHFVARRLADDLSRLGFEVSVDFEFVPSERSGYVVIAPQVFPQLPQTFVAFQMEQSVNPRWFTPQYLEALKGAEAVFDYALENIEYLLGQGVPMSQLFYVPITPAKADTESQHGPREHRQAEASYDFAFYGDPSAPRRKELLEALRQHFRVTIISEVFGDELFARLRQARAVVNIHYYEGALLETTRLSEALSEGFAVLSEDVANKSTQAQFASDRVVFFRTGDAQDMVAKAHQLIETLRRPGLVPAVNNEWEPGLGAYVARYLTYRGQIPMSVLSGSFYPASARSELFPRICLSLPETPARQSAFARENRHGFHVFHGLRGTPGWVGCARSYRFLAREALTTRAQYVTICEDDVAFKADFAERFALIERWLRENPDKWDIFSGLIADLHQDARVIDVIDLNGIRLVAVDKMTSMVMNVYSRRALKLMSLWNEHDRDVQTNTIDRYLERSTNLRVVIALPYLVDHSEHLTSTLWEFKNTQYNNMIQTSEQLLRDKATHYLSESRAEIGRI